MFLFQHTRLIGMYMKRSSFANYGIVLSASLGTPVRRVTQVTVLAVHAVLSDLPWQTSPRIGQGL